MLIVSSVSLWQKNVEISTECVLREAVAQAVGLRGRGTGGRVARPRHIWSGRVLRSADTACDEFEACSSPF